MPYITQPERESGIAPQTPGQLTYRFTLLIVEYLRNKGIRYATFSDILGALEGTKLEFYARIVRPYENGKKKLNGDVYDV